MACVVENHLKIGIRRSSKHGIQIQPAAIRQGRPFHLYSACFFRKNPAKYKPDFLFCSHEWIEEAG
ncbi:hypothetical protein J7E71_16625 [Mesobacillus foraminis]|uniref:hypothetical protein n=1 Tax=Mesobacillus foraminis TaxID=279826 RepID=UPI001BE90456|nr:hypothetical protein [Mesobacillus foraminis]MBT2757520.1 hypothetical protein [Mesobacillus foraminis]